MKKELLVLTLLAAAAATVYWLCDPIDSPWLPACPLYHLTGWQCPFCGGQRMTHALLHGQWEEAWHHNALLLLTLPWWALIAASYMMRRRNPALYNRLLSTPSVAVMLAIAAIWGLYRNIML